MRKLERLIEVAYTTILFADCLDYLHIFSMGEQVLELL